MLLSESQVVVEPLATGTFVWKPARVPHLADIAFGNRTAVLP